MRNLKTFIGFAFWERYLLFWLKDRQAKKGSPNILVSYGFLGGSDKNRIVWSVYNRVKRFVERVFNPAFDRFIGYYNRYWSASIPYTNWRKDGWEVCKFAFLIVFYILFPFWWLWGHYIFTKLTLFILSIPGFITSVITNSITSFISFFVTSLAGSFFALGDTFLYFVLPTAAFCLAIGVPQIINPISALFCLIGVFLAVIFILLSLQVEFLSMVFLIVYIGAIAILFLFVIMILHLEKIDPYYLMSTDWRYYRVFLVLPLFYFSAEIYWNVIQATYGVNYYNTNIVLDTLPITVRTVDNTGFWLAQMNDILLFSDLLYKQHASLFILNGMILLAAMIGAIVLALSTLKGK